MDEDDDIRYDIRIKLLLIGDSNVGKSSIIKRFVDDEFNENLPATIGMDYDVKMMDIESKRVQVTIWDTSGQEKFRSLSSSYYRGTEGIILVYDVTNRESFDNIKYWVNEINLHSTKDNNIILLIGNKIDKNNIVISKHEGEDMAKNNGMLFIETSAKTEIGITQAFNEVIFKIFESGIYRTTDLIVIRTINPHNSKLKTCLC
jgi:Ras-related protein Rab-18